MNIFGKSKIGRQIVALVLLSVTLSVVTLTGGFLWLQLRDNIAARQAGIQVTGYVFASAIADHVVARNHHSVLDALRSIRRIPNVRYVVAIDGEGREIASLGSVVTLQSEIVDRKTGWVSQLTRGWFPVVTEIVKADQPVGRLVIIADVSEFRSQVARAAVATLIAALAAGGLGVAAALRLQRRITDPISSLINAMRHIRSARDYTTQVEHQSDDETGVLVDTFNGMMAEIGYRDESLKRLAYFDPLTGLANRQEFQRQLDALLVSAKHGGRCAALWLLDLDEFKAINDSYGHSVGDSLLLDVAARFKAECKDNQFLVRLGGDEFAVIAPGIDSEGAAQAAIAPIIASLARPVKILGRQILISASAGVVMVPRDGTNAADLLRRVDLALYDAKREGRGRVHFYQARLEEEVQRQTAMAQDLRHAVVGRQLQANYQPQVDIRSGKVGSFESLLRWQHPEHGFVSPAKFIPIAENNGLICDLGQWILKESCRQAKAWIDEGSGFEQVAVNVSMTQIRQIGFVEEVEQILSETGLPASALCLELTESIFAGASRQQVRHVLETIKSIGVSLAIDDFGTGYSSLSYLQGLPFDKLKIDRAFVSRLDTDSGKRRLLRGMIELGHALDLLVVAEGAETETEVAALREMGADRVQGYVFSAPLAASEVIATARLIEVTLREGPRGAASLKTG